MYIIGGKQSVLSSRRTENGRPTTAGTTWMETIELATNHSNTKSEKKLVATEILNAFFSELRNVEQIKTGVGLETRVGYFSSYEE